MLYENVIFVLLYGVALFSLWVHVEIMHFFGARFPVQSTFDIVSKKRFFPDIRRILHPLSFRRHSGRLASDIYELSTLTCAREKLPKSNTKAPNIVPHVIHPSVLVVFLLVRPSS